MDKEDVKGHDEGCLELADRYIVAGRYASCTVPTIAVGYQSKNRSVPLPSRGGSLETQRIFKTKIKISVL
jgi:hypothetical protein